jgi:hypothetical protein
MTNALNNPRRARVVAAVVLIFSLSLGTTVSLNRQSRRVAQMFYDGVPDTAQGYTRPSVDSQLTVRADAALGLITAADGIGAESEISDLRAAREELLAADSIKEKADANARLSRAFTALLKRVYSADSARASELARTYSNEFDGAMYLIAASGFTEAVLDFQSDAKSFPTRIFAINSLIKYPRSY